MLEFYPDKNSLKEVMLQKLSISDVKEMCKANGIFLLSNDKECVVNSAHLFFWGYNDINFLANAIDDERNNKKSIRLSVEPKQGERSTYNALLNKIQNRLNSQRDYERLTIEEVRNIDTNKQEVVFRYIKHQKGRVRLLDEVQKNFTLLITGNEDNSAVIDVTHDDSSDVKIIKDEVQRLIGTDENVYVKQVTLKTLTLANRVNLFDRFYGYAFDNWLTDEIKSIKLVKDEQYLENEDDADDDGEHIDNSILSGINSALLTGTALRTNVFVQNSLQKGYYFSQTTVRLAHKIEGIKISIDIIFRGKERLLEINVSGSYEIEDGRDFKKALPINEQREYLRCFHDIINDIYEQLLTEQSISK